MESNNIYNLMTQLTQESKSLWRIKNQYMSEAATDAERAVWNDLAAQKEATILALKDLIKTSL